jgi:hypothetical protein
MWTDDSVVTVQNSVKGSTDVTLVNFVATSHRSATLLINVGLGMGAYTITVDGVVSPPLTVGLPRIGNWFPALSRHSPRIGP